MSNFQKVVPPAKKWQGRIILVVPWRKASQHEYNPRMRINCFCINLYSSFSAALSNTILRKQGIACEDITNEYIRGFPSDSNSVTFRVPVQRVLEDLWSPVACMSYGHWFLHQDLEIVLRNIFYLCYKIKNHFRIWIYEKGSNKVTQYQAKKKKDWCFAHVYVILYILLKKIMRSNTYLQLIMVWMDVWRLQINIIYCMWCWEVQQ